MKIITTLTSLAALSTLMLGSCVDAKEPEAIVAQASSPAAEAYAITEAPLSAGPAITTPVDPESDAILANVRYMTLSREDFIVSLGALDTWVKGKPEGYARWGAQQTPQGDFVMLMVNYRYDGGDIAELGFVFGPIAGPEPLPLFMGYRGEERLSKSETESILDGFILDMYHQGLVSSH